MDRQQEIIQFRDLFSGLVEAYGFYNVQHNGQKGTKQVGERGTKREQVTFDLWEKHILGEQGLGICPINSQNECNWGCIDIDEYNLDHKQVARQIKKFKLPLVMCRSKSGGAHVFIFFQEPVAAGLVQKKLKELSAGMGYGQSEIFPKQAQILVERGDVGSWLNLPYFDSEATVRYALDEEARSLSLREFLTYAHDRQVDEQTFLSLSIETSVDEFDGGPPCLQHLISQGFPEGTRNNGLYNLCTFARKAYPDNWQAKVEEWNRRYMQPPLDSSEVHGILKSASKKDYAYKCQEPPINSFCNAGICRARQHGVGGQGDYIQLNSLTKLNTTPPIWFVDVEGGRLELETEELQTQRKFQKKCMDALNKMPPFMKAGPWQAMIQSLLDQATIIDCAEEISPEGYLMELLTQYFSRDTKTAQRKEDILFGHPWYDDEENCVYFKLVGLMEYLQQRKYRDLSRHQIASKLKKFGAEHTQVKIKGINVRVFKMPRMEGTEEITLDVPEQEEEIF